MFYFMLFLMICDFVSSLILKVPTHLTRNSQKTKLECVPKMRYIDEKITCVCNSNGYWPHASCRSVFTKSKRNTPTCEPNGYMKVGCNICRCDGNGKVDPEACTKNVCDQTQARRSSDVISNCEENKWYAISPCQFCYCVNKNKLTCTIGAETGEKLDMGNYKLTACDTDLKKDVLSLTNSTKLILRNIKVTTKATKETVENKEDYKAKTPERTKKESSSSSDLNASDEVRIGKIGSNAKEDEEDHGPVENNAKSVYTLSDKDSDEDSNEDKLTAATEKSAERRGQNDLLFTMLPENLDSDDDETNLHTENNQIATDSSASVELKTKNNEKDSTESLDFETLNLPLRFQVKDKHGKVEDSKSFLHKLPEMLRNFIKVAIRKSMLSFKPGDKCTPGTQYREGCNLCFCLENGKTLCSNKKC